MEPWPFSHGYATMSVSFHGDDLALQWSHGPSAMDTGDRLYSRIVIRHPSMEPWPFSHGYGTGVAGGERLAQSPSMEPWPFSHGYSNTLHLPDDLSSPSMEPWPFSHGYEVNPHAVVPGANFPSMEPWPFSHGYLFGGDGRARPEPDPSMEPWPFSHGYRPHALQVMVELRPSMEPWPFSHGYTICRGCGSVTNWSFNRAMALQPWIPGPEGPQSADDHDPSMEPWPFSHGYRPR